MARSSGPDGVGTGGLCATRSCAEQTNSEQRITKRAFMSTQGILRAWTHAQQRLRGFRISRPSLLGRPKSRGEFRHMRLHLRSDLARDLSQCFSPTSGVYLQVPTQRRSFSSPDSPIRESWSDDVLLERTGVNFSDGPLISVGRHAIVPAKFIYSFRPETQMNQ